MNPAIAEEIIAEISNFDAICKESESTDTGDAWDLLNWISDRMEREAPPQYACPDRGATYLGRRGTHDLYYVARHGSTLLAVYGDSDGEYKSMGFDQMRALIGQDGVRKSPLGVAYARFIERESQLLEEE
jgi:hypothetical protein